MRPPVHVEPMLATLGTLPRDETAFAYELKWDGIRAVAHWPGGDGSLRLETRTRRDVTVAFPELVPLGPALGAVPVVLDGEVVALDAAGVPSFQRLQERMHVADPAIAARRTATCPVIYVVFDVLHLGDEALLGLPWTERRQRLDALALAGASWVTSPAFTGEEAGTDTFEAAQRRGMEGVVAKRLNSTYVPGARSKTWVKVKIVHSDEYLVGGWLPGEGNRSGRIGALLVGQPDGEGGLAYNGAVGTGFTASELGRLAARLAERTRATSPFATPVPRKDARFVVPDLVVDIEHRGVTNAGILRQPSYKGMRIDKTAADVKTGGAETDGHTDEPPA